MNLFSRIAQAALLTLALAGSAFAAAPVERVNINTADVATLDRVLLNVGPAKAAAIVAYRKSNGGFRSIDQLALVKGIGLRTIERNRDRIVLGSAVVPARARPAAATARPTGGRMPMRAGGLQR